MFKIKSKERQNLDTDFQVVKEDSVKGWQCEHVKGYMFIRTQKKRNIVLLLGNDAGSVFIQTSTSETDRSNGESMNQ